MERNKYKSDGEREQQVLHHLVNFKNRYGYCPSFSELASLIGISKSRVSQIIERLETKNLIRKEGNKARTIQVMIKV